MSKHEAVASGQIPSASAEAARALRMSLVIPCYNEARNLPALVDRLRAIDDELVDIILVDNGSTDDSPAVMEALIRDCPRIASVRVPVNRGYGFGILAGLHAATGDVLAWTHADRQTDPLDAVIGFDRFRAATDPRVLFVKGLRYGRPMVDAVFTAGMSLFETALTGRVMRDINAQPTMFHRSFFESWTDAPDDFALDLYAYWRAKAARLAFQRFPVRFGPRQFGNSHWNTGMKGRLKFIRRTIAFSLKLKGRLHGAVA